MSDDSTPLIPVERLMQKLRGVDGPVSATRAYELSRSRRKREARATTFSTKRWAKRDREAESRLNPYPEDVVRPMTRRDCEGGERPCPFVSCAHHLYLDVSTKTGAIKLNFPDLEPDEIAESCALDVADREGVTLEEVGSIMNLTRERVRQIEAMACAKLSDADRDVDRLGVHLVREKTHAFLESEDELLGQDGMTAIRDKAMAFDVRALPRPPIRHVEVGANGLRVGDVVKKP